jgi:hypothetical protein
MGRPVGVSGSFNIYIENFTILRSICGVSGVNYPLILGWFCCLLSVINIHRFFFTLVPNSPVSLNPCHLP